jgi:hypothetical protein
MQRKTKMFKHCFTYIFITYKATLLLHRNYHYNNSTVVITNWLIAKKYSFLKWQLIFSLSRGIFLPYSITDKTFTGREYTNVWIPRQILYKKQELLTLWEHMSSSPIFWWGSSCSSFWFSVCVCVCLSFSSSVSLDCPFVIALSVFSNIYLFIIYVKARWFQIFNTKLECEMSV